MMCGPLACLAFVTAVSRRDGKFYWGKKLGKKRGWCSHPGCESQIFVIKPSEWPQMKVCCCWRIPMVPLLIVRGLFYAIVNIQ